MTGRLPASRATIAPIIAMLATRPTLAGVGIADVVAGLVANA